MFFNKVFYVFFKKSASTSWYFKYILDPDISHCLTLEEHVVNGYTFYQKVESLYNYAETEVLFEPLKDIISRLEFKYKVIKVNISINPYKISSKLVHMNCVGLTKRLLGVDKTFILTPKQLYTYLIGKGNLIYDTY